MLANEGFCNLERRPYSQINTQVANHKLTKTIAGFIHRSMSCGNPRNVPNGEPFYLSTFWHSSSKHLGSKWGNHPYQWILIISPVGHFGHIPATPHFQTTSSQCCITDLHVAWAATTMVQVPRLLGDIWTSALAKVKHHHPGRMIGMVGMVGIFCRDRFGSQSVAAICRIWPNGVT